MTGRIKSPAPFEMTLSFEQDAAEHVAVMFAAGRRYQDRNPADLWVRLASVIGFAIVLGLAMELHRRYVIPAWLGRSDFPAFGEMVFYFLPAFLLTGIFVTGFLWWWWHGKFRSRLMGHVRHKTLVGMDLSRAGVKMTTDETEMFFHWSAIRHMEMDFSLILMDSATFTIYVPERAFADRKAFVAGFHQIQTLWRHGMQNEIEGRDHLR